MANPSKGCGHPCIFWIATSPMAPRNDGFSVVTKQNHLCFQESLECVWRGFGSHNFFCRPINCQTTPHYTNQNKNDQAKRRRPQIKINHPPNHGANKNGGDKVCTQTKAASQPLGQRIIHVYALVFFRPPISKILGTLGVIDLLWATKGHGIRRHIFGDHTASCNQGTVPNG